MTKQAEQRLEAIQRWKNSARGFYLAMHDLEIRGAGEVLGESSRAKCRKSALSCLPTC